MMYFPQQENTKTGGGEGWEEGETRHISPQEEFVQNKVLYNQPFPEP